MRKIILSIAAILFCISAFAINKQNLKVLYVGGTSDYYESTPETIADRTAIFGEYLKQYFTNVTVIDGKDYKMEMSANYDVTIFDGSTPIINPQVTVKRDNGETDYFRAKRLSEDFAYPAILIADLGEVLGRAIGTKTDWYCLCLDADAHHINLEHPIFKGPFKTKITITDKPTPEDAFHYEYYTGKLPKTTPMWRVQTKGYISDPGFRVGMVSRPWGFLDSPETEMISSGVCAKTIDAVAIGRHGNFFFWGFSASPKYMTDEAKQVFANAVVYTASLKGQKVIARKYFDRAATKEYIKEIIYLSSEEQYKARLELEKEFRDEQLNHQKELKAKKERGEQLSKREEQELNIDLSTYKESTYEEYLQKNMRDYYDTFGTDVEAYHKFLRDNEPYLYGAGMFYKLIIDEDAKSLGIANTDIRLLERAISMLETGEKAGKSDVEAQNNYAKAQRILDRYTLCTFTKAAEWRKWFDTYKDKIFFSQAGGWYFLVNTTDPSVAGNDYKAKGIYSEGRKLVLDETTDNEPVATAAKLITLDGGSRFVIVKMKIRNGYHIYGNVSAQDPYIATEVKLDLPDGCTAGAMTLPASSFFNNKGTTQYTDDILFTIPVNGDIKGKITVTVNYQCCDSQVCLPPVEKQIVL